MGQKRSLVAMSSAFFEKGKKFFSKLGAEPHGPVRVPKSAETHGPARGAKKCGAAAGT